MMTASIFEIKHFAVHDGDGIRTTVFFKGCPLRCVWCHNPEGLELGVQQAFYEHKCIGCGECRRDNFCTEDCAGEARTVYGREITLDALLPILLEDIDFYQSSGGGVTLSGGECLMQADFCAALLKRLKECGIHTAVDTCGAVPWEAFAKVAPYTDVFLYDVKAMDEDIHRKCTGASNRQILENLARLDEMGKLVEIRIPYVPDCNDGQMAKIADFLSTLQNVSAIRVLPYHNYAGSKYEALGMENMLPSRLPTEPELQAVRRLMREKTGKKVFDLEE